jgi:hypothetical protein
MKTEKLKIKITTKQLAYEFTKRSHFQIQNQYNAKLAKPL